MAGNEVRIHAGVKDDVSGPLDKIRDKFDQLGKSKGAQSILQGVGVGVGIKAFDMLSGAIGAASGAIDGAIKGAIADEAASAKLDAALKANVEGWNGNRDAINAYIDAQVKRGFIDDDTTAAMTTLVAATHDVAKAQQVLSVAEDLARLKGIGLTDAADALTKVEAGSYKILKSLGIVLKDGATQTEALAAVEKVAAGQAEAFGKTTAGAMARVSAQADQLSDKVGAKLAPALGFLADQASAAFDVLDNTAHANALVDQTGAFVSAGYSADTYRDALKGVAEQYADAVNSGRATEQELADLQAVMKLLNDATKLTTGSIATAKSGFGGFHSASTDVFTGLQNVTKALKGTTAAALAGYKPTHDYFDIYTEVASKGDIAQTEKDLRADRDAIREAKDAMDKATPGTRKYLDAQSDLAIAQGQLADDTMTLRKRQAELFLLKPDKANTAAIGKWFHDIGLNVADLTGDLKTAYDAFYRLTHPDVKGGSTVQFNVSWGGKKLAGGGSLDRGEPAIVGEHGPEWFVPDASGTVLPHGKTPRGGGGTLNVNVSVMAGNGVITPGAALDIGNAVGPVILKWMQRNGAVPMTGTPQSG